MPIYRTDFDIEASAADVWAVLTDFEAFPEWNPSLPSISGKLQVGEVVSLTLGMPGKAPMNVTAVIQELEPNRRFTWRGHVGAAWLFSGYRVFGLEALSPTRTRFTHVEDIGGILAPVFHLFMGAAVQESHDAFNRSLKQRVERSPQ